MSSSSSRPVPRIILLSQDGSDDLLKGFPGRFLVTVCRDGEHLESLLLGSAIDLVVVDCRRQIPPTDLLDLVRGEPGVDYLAVGQPDSRRSIPSYLHSHWCPWPVDRRSFYRLVVAMARKVAWQRAYQRQEHRIRALTESAELGGRVAQVLHEINNPLDAVQRFINLAKSDDDKNSEEVARWLDHASLGLERMAQTLGELQRDARQSHSRLELLPIRQIVREAAVLSGVSTDRLGVRTKILCDDERAPRALAPVLVNLLRNARQACGPQGNIDVEVARQDDHLILRVTDDGVGFGELFKDELFKPYFSTKEEGGMGLGLPTARAAVEQLGGKLEGFSAGENRGATFVVEVPVFDAPTATAAETENEDSSSTRPPTAAEEEDRENES